MVQAPQCLSNLVNTYVPSRALSSSEQGLLCIPKIGTKKFGARAFTYAAPMHYDALRQTYVDLHRLTCLRVDLKPISSDSHILSSFKFLAKQPYI